MGPETLICYTIQGAKRCGLISVCDAEDFIRMNDGRVPSKAMQEVFVKVFGADSDIRATAVCNDKIVPVSMRSKLGPTSKQKSTRSQTMDADSPSERAKKFIVDSGTFEADPVLGLTLPCTNDDAEHVRRSVYRDKNNKELYFRDEVGTKKVMRDPGTHQAIVYHYVVTLNRTAGL